MRSRRRIDPGNASWPVDAMCYRLHRRGLLLAGLLASLVSSAPLAAQQTLRHIDWYGLREVDAEDAAEALGVGPGAPADFDRDAAKARLRELPGIEEATILLMLIPGQEIALVGVRETDAVRLQVREAPRGEATIPDAFVAAYDAAMQAGLEGMRKGFGTEDHSQGHALSGYEPAREHQLRARALVDDHLDALRAALRDAADSKQRAVAAWALAYASDKASITSDLAYAMRDPDAGVRNNAVRALSVMAKWARSQDDFELVVDCSPLVEMLESLTWTDRNKSAALLAGLVRGNEPLQRQLHERSLPALEEMARWTSAGHAGFSVELLAAIAGEDPQAIADEFWSLRGDAAARAELVERIVRGARARRWDR